MATAFPLTSISTKTTSFDSCEKMSGRKRKIILLEERVKVVDRLSKVESARAISISLSVGKTQIQTIAKEKDEIRCRCSYAGPF